MDDLLCHLRRDEVSLSPKYRTFTPVILMLMSSSGNAGYESLECFNQSLGGFENVSSFFDMFRI